VADTFALAMQGTTRVASNIVDDSSFMAKVSRDLGCTRRNACALRTLANVWESCYNFGGI
jgi:hypothetical protein